MDIFTFKLISISKKSYLKYSLLIRQPLLKIYEFNKTCIFLSISKLKNQENTIVKLKNTYMLVSIIKINIVCIIIFLMSNIDIFII